MTKNDRVNLGSKQGVILAAAGLAVGLGNVWRFPYETGNHGGAAFILVYIGCVLILGLPILIAEFMIGRRSKANTIDSYQVIASFQSFSSNPWQPVSRLVVFLLLTHFIIVKGVEKGIEKSSNNMLPLGGLFISLFAGWNLDKQLVWSKITNNDSLNIPVFKLIIFILKYIAPIGIALMFVNELNIIRL